MGLENIRVVLVGPLYGGNVGSVCRAMANMGMSDLALVDPQALDPRETRMMACHAYHLYENRHEYPTLGEAVADCSLIMGTTARIGLYRSHARGPREWAARAVEGAHSGRVAVVFGRENNGLSNEELAMCTQIVQIPTAPEFSSLNIAQAAMICLYEIFVAAGNYEPIREKSPEAPSDLRERMFAMWREMLMTIGFMKDDKADHMMYGLRRIFSRGPLSRDDVRILMGVARQAKWAALGVKEADASRGSPESVEGTQI